MLSSPSFGTRNPLEVLGRLESAPDLVLVCQVSQVDDAVELVSQPAGLGLLGDVVLWGSCPTGRVWAGGLGLGNGPGGTGRMPS